MALYIWGPVVTQTLKPIIIRTNLSWLPEDDDPHTKLPAQTNGQEADEVLMRP